MNTDEANEMLMRARASRSSSRMGWEEERRGGWLRKLARSDGSKVIVPDLLEDPSFHDWGTSSLHHETVRNLR